MSSLQVIRTSAAYTEIKNKEMLQCKKIVETRMS